IFTFILSHDRFSFIISYLFFHTTLSLEIYTLSLHDALPISNSISFRLRIAPLSFCITSMSPASVSIPRKEIAESRSAHATEISRSEEHTSELQSRGHLVCRLLLEKKKKQNLQK